MAVEVLSTADGRAKTALSHAHAAAWRASREAGAPLPVGRAEPPARPARTARPELLPPRVVPRRRPGTREGQIAIRTDRAHNEVIAVDLGWSYFDRFHRAT